MWCEVLCGLLCLLVLSAVGSPTDASASCVWEGCAESSMLQVHSQGTPATEGAIRDTAVAKVAKPSLLLREQEVLVDTKLYDESLGRTVEQLQYQPGVALELDQDGSSTVLEAIRRKGGLIQDFKLDGRSILFNRPFPNQMDGAIFWPGPQSGWGWPPPLEIDPTPSKDYALAYDLEVDRNARAFVLTSPVSPQVNLQLSKRVSMDAERGAMVLDYSIKNTGGETQSWAPWEIARVRPGGLTFYTTGASPPTSGPWPALPVVEAAGATWFQQKATGGKLYADTGSGWLAHTDGELVFVKCFEKLATGSHAPGEQQVEIYDGGDYVEVEQQGTYAPIAPGARLQWRVFWYLRPMPPGASATAGNPELLAFVQGLCGKPI